MKFHSSLLLKISYEDLRSKSNERWLKNEPKKAARSAVQLSHTSSVTHNDIIRKKSESEVQSQVYCDSKATLVDPWISNWISRFEEKKERFETSR